MNGRIGKFAAVASLLAALAGAGAAASAITAASAPAAAAAASAPAAAAHHRLAAPLPGGCVAKPENQNPGIAHSRFPLASYAVGTAGTIRASSPTIVQVSAGETVAVFADEAGWLYVVNAATCQELPGWPRRIAVDRAEVGLGQVRSEPPAARHAVVESAPAVGWLDGPGEPPSIVVSVGSTFDNTGIGEVVAYSLAGNLEWSFPVRPSPGNANGVWSSPAIGEVVPGTGEDVVFGSWDYYLYVLSGRSGQLLADYYNAETIWSSPALFPAAGDASCSGGGNAAGTTGATTGATPGATGSGSAATPCNDIFIGLDKTQSQLPGGCVGGRFAELRYDAQAVGPPIAHTKVPIDHGLEVVRQSACQGATNTPALARTAVHEQLSKHAPPRSAPAPPPPTTTTVPARELYHGQAIWSSPAIGELAGQQVAAVGTSWYDAPFGPGTDAVYVYPLAPWSAKAAPSTVPVAAPWQPLFVEPAPGPTYGSPAIGPLYLGKHENPVDGLVETSFVCPAGKLQTLASCQSSKVSETLAWVPNWRDTTLRQRWTQHLNGPTDLGSPVLAPLSGGSTNDVLVGAGGGLYPLRGTSGRFLDGAALDPPEKAIHSACRLFNTPAVADVHGRGGDPYTGWYAFELCSIGTESDGGLYAFPLPKPPSGTPAWPMFRGDPSHSGVSWVSLGQAPPAGDPVS